MRSSKKQNTYTINFNIEQKLVLVLDNGGRMWLTIKIPSQPKTVWY